METLLKNYIDKITRTLLRGDAREESYYPYLKELVESLAKELEIPQIDVTVLPKKTEAGNPDFRIWDGQNHITGYIEAKAPGTDLDKIEHSKQLKRYLSTFPNLILTDFYEFRLYRDGELVARASIGRPLLARKLQTVPPVEKAGDFRQLFQRFFAFSVPRIRNAKALAVELAKRTRFLRDEVITVEMAGKDQKGARQIQGFYQAFKKYLIATLTEKQFADLYAQTLTYGLFAARTRANGDFNRKLAYEYIPRTIGILRDVFRFISLGDPPPSLQVIVDDIAAVLHAADVYSILHEYSRSGKGRDPIVHFYETFLAHYDPKMRERRGVYYTPEPVVDYIIRAVHSLLKSRFDLNDGLAHPDVKLLDPAGGTLTFPAEAIRLATDEFTRKYGTGGLHNWIQNHILQNYYAFELMMAPYAIGHLKIGFILEELGYRMQPDERFQLYLTNTLEMEEIDQINIPGLASLSRESHLAAQIKKQQPILVITGNPPYSGISANPSETIKLIKKGFTYIAGYSWDNKNNILIKREKTAKRDIKKKQKTFIGEILMEYYFVDGKPLGEKKLWLQDDYVKFLRFAQWKIQKSGHGIVAMITNHSYLDNPTFRGMRQSLMRTFDEIYILNLHGNSLKKETAPDGSKDENVFDIRQGVAIGIFMRNRQPATTPRVYYADLYGTREHKYTWLDTHDFDPGNYEEIRPASPWYFFIPRHTASIQHYLEWKRIDDVFPVNVTGIVTARDRFVIGFDEKELKNRILQFRNLSIPDDIIAQTYKLKNTRGWKLHEARIKLAEDPDWDTYFTKILYRPFDIRTIYYTETMVDWPRPEVMRHMLQENVGLCFMRQFSGNIPYSHFLVSRFIIDNRTFFSSKGIIQLAPLYLYPDPDKKDLFNQGEAPGERQPNIADSVFRSLETAYGVRPSPEEILHYVYAVFYSNIYREKYAEFLKIDFPRVPFTANLEVFKQMAAIGRQLTELHLLESSLLDPPVAKYQGTGGNDRIEKIVYDEKTGRIYINPDKYFEGIVPEVWNYYIGGYQVLNKYLNDRKGRIMDDAPHYCRIVTALQKTIELQNEIDRLYPAVEEDMLSI